MAANSKLKSTTEGKKDQKSQIYKSREQKIEKLIEVTQKASKYTVELRNEYIKSVTIDTHQIGKMVSYLSTGVEKEQPSLYKEAINFIKI